MTRETKPNLGLNYAGLPILPGESYGGRPEFTDPDCPETLSGTGKRKRTVGQRVNMKQRGFGNGYWAELRNDPKKMAEHLRKQAEGRARVKKT
jgi:hypothetical protein